MEVADGLVELATTSGDADAEHCTVALQALELLAAEKQDLVVVYHAKLATRLLQLAEAPGSRRHLACAANLLRLLVMHPHSQHDVLQCPGLVVGLQQIVESGDTTTFLAVGEICAAGLAAAKQHMVASGVENVVAYLLANSVADAPRRVAAQCRKQLFETAEGARAR